MGETGKRRSSSMTPHWPETSLTSFLLNRIRIKTPEISYAALTLSDALDADNRPGGFLNGDALKRYTATGNKRQEGLHKALAPFPTQHLSTPVAVLKLKPGGAAPTNQLRPPTAKHPSTPVAVLEPKGPTYTYQLRPPAPTPTPARRPIYIHGAPSIFPTPVTTASPPARCNSHRHEVPKAQVR